MAAAAFTPGFRLSKLDLVVLLAGVAGALLFGALVWWAGFVIAFVIAHFFLFCSVFRLSRPLELVWAAIFVTLAASTVTAGFPGWWVTAGVSLAATVAVVAIQMRRPSYHGVGWQRINPGLRRWWEMQRRK